MTLTKTTNYMPITKVKKKNFAICMWRFMFGSCNLDWSIFQVISMLTYLLKCVTLSIYSNLKKKKSAPKNDFRNHHCVYYLKTYMVFIWQMVLVFQPQCGIFGHLLTRIDITRIMIVISHYTGKRFYPG